MRQQQELDYLFECVRYARVTAIICALFGLPVPLYWLHSEVMGRYLRGVAA